MAAGMGDQFCLRWNNYHFNMTSVVNQLLADEAFVDVTLSCEGARIKAHRVVLSACSPYFQRVLMDNPCKHPVLILPVGVGHADLRAIVEFIYRGETYVTRDQLSSIVRVAELLKIKGLCEVSQQQTEPQNASNSSSVTSAGITQVSEHHTMVTNSVQTTYGKPVTELSTQAATHTPNTGNQQQNNVVVSVTSSQNAMQQGNQASGQQQQQPTTPRPNYTSLYRGRSRGRRPVGNFPSRGGWGSSAAIGGEKRNAAQANLGPGNSGGLRRPIRGSYRGAWQGRSPMKNAGGTGGGASSSNEDNTLGSDIMEESNNVQMRQDSDHGVDDSSVGYHDNTSSESHPPASTNLDAQNLYGPPTNMEHLANHGAWSHMTHQSGHNFSPSANSASSATANQERAFKTEPEQANDFAHPNSRPPSQEVNTPTSVDNDRNGHEDSGDLTVTPEILGLMPSHISLHPTGGAAHHHLHHSSHSQHHHHSGMNVTIPMHPETTSKKMYTPEAMEAALESLRSGTMSLSRAAAVYGIPSTTLWQRAHRLGIDTPMKKDPSSRHWSEDDLRMALEALRAGRISANRASKEYGIPSSTLYKIARKEGIKLAAPFNASPTNWSPEDLVRALEAIRGGMSVQRAATQFGIPSGTLYGRCKREGIELVHKSYSGDRPWSDSSMSEAMESVRSGEMSINQAAIHYNVPYSSLYNRIKRIKALEEMGEGYDASLAEGTNHPEEEVYEEDMDEEDPMMMGSSDHGPNGPPGANTTSPPAGHGHPMASGQSTSSFAPHNSYMGGHMSLPIPITMDYQNFSQGNPTQNPPPPNAAAYQQ